MAKKKKQKIEFKFNQFAKNPRITDNEKLEKLDENLEEFGDLSGIVHNIRTDELICGNQRGKTLQIDQSKITIVEQYEQADEQGTVSLGYIEHNGHKYNFRQVDWSEEKADKAAVIANVHAGSWDFEKLGSDWDSSFLQEVGFKDWEIGFTEQNDENLDDFEDDDLLEDDESIDSSDDNDEITITLSMSRTIYEQYESEINDFLREKDEIVCKIVG